MDIKFGSAVVKNRFNFNFLGTQHVYCVRITLEMPLKHGSVCQFFRSDFFLSQHGKKTKLVQHLKVVHVFNTMSCGREEEVKLLVSAFSFAFTVSIFPSFSSGPYFFCVNYIFFLSDVLVISTRYVPSFLSQPCPFRSQPVLSCRPCPLISTLSFRFCLQFLRCSFQPRSFRLNPAPPFPPYPFVLRFAFFVAALFCGFNPLFLFQAFFLDTIVSIQPFFLFVSIFSIGFMKLVKL